MKGKIVSVDHLGFDEASRIEGDWGRFSDNELSELSQGKSASSIRSELENGDIALIVDSPSSPLLLREGQGFSVSKSNAPLLSESGAKKIGHRFSGNYSGGTVAKPGGALHPPKPMPKYIPEPIVKNQNDKSQPFYEYCFEVACSEKAFFANIGCDFLLSKTESESQIGKWEVSLSDNGVKYKALICINEHKGFVIQTNSIPMGISIPKKITPRHIGSNVIKDSYIPIMPAIQVGEHLGFPTEGYFYHFNDEQLIQEYKILGEGECSFFGTKSRQGYLNNEREYNRDQGAFLVFGLINGEMSENQFIFYREEQLTLSELSEINGEWLSQNGIKLDINAIMEAKTLPVIQRPVLPQEKKEDETVHIVQVDPETNKREMWPTIAGKYGLSANELLEINSHFKADPMELKVGDKLQIKKTVKKVKEVVTETPLEAPQAYNQPLNTYYRYTDRFLPDTTVKTINSESLIDPEITIVNVSKNRVEESIFIDSNELKKVLITDNPKFNRIKKSTLKPLFSAVKNGISKNELLSEMSKIQTEKWVKYSKTKRFIVEKIIEHEFSLCSDAIKREIPLNEYLSFDNEIKIEFSAQDDVLEKDIYFNCCVRNKNYTILPFVDKAINRAPLKNDVLSFRFTGCLMSTYAINGDKVVTHVSTSTNKKVDRKKDMKKILSQSNVREINTFKPCDMNLPNVSVIAEYLYRYKQNPVIIGLVTTNLEYYAIMTSKKQGNKYEIIGIINCSNNQYNWNSV